MLFPKDLLVSASYRKNANGTILDFDPASLTASDLVFHYAAALAWKPDVVVWLHYPLEELHE
jgi:hypothetical protein